MIREALLTLRRRRRIRSVVAQAPAVLLDRVLKHFPGPRRNVPLAVSVALEYAEPVFRNRILKASQLLFGFGEPR